MSTTFANLVYQAAIDSPRYASNIRKVWIIDVYRTGRFARQGVLLSEFKALLVQANRERLITLSRCDMPHALNAMDMSKCLRSSTVAGVAEFNWVRV